MIKPDISLEKLLWKKGFYNIAGVDEVGKGPWAGPVVAGAIIIHSENQVISLVKDSKFMTKIQREKAFPQIIKSSSAFGIGIVRENEIDIIGIKKAVKKAMTLALRNITLKFGLDISFAIIDGSKTMPLTNYRALRILKGGLYHYSISAASVLAKVTRDKIMNGMAKKYPNYGFEKHVGYGTKMHFNALETFGVSPIHRKSFIPVKNMI